MKYIIKKLDDVSEMDECSVDPEYTIASLSALISGHNCGALNIENECWFGHKDNYQFASKIAPTLVRVK